MFRNRKYPRMNKDYHISYTPIDTEQFACDQVSSLAVNISGGGVCFTATEAMAKGAMVALDISGDNLLSPIMALAKVVWCKEKRNAYEVGVEFWWVGWRNSDAQHTMADFITTKTTAPQAALAE